LGKAEAQAGGRKAVGGEAPTAPGRTRLNLDIDHRENGVTARWIIADALLRFEPLLGKLPVEEQTELVRLIIRAITLKQHAPDPDPELKAR
jgi:hypothetical protein